MNRTSTKGQFFFSSHYCPGQYVPQSIIRGGGGGSTTTTMDSWYSMYTAVTSRNQLKIQSQSCHTRNSAIFMPFQIASDWFLGGICFAHPVHRSCNGISDWMPKGAVIPCRMSPHPTCNNHNETTAAQRRCFSDDDHPHDLRPRTVLRMYARIHGSRRGGGTDTDKKTWHGTMMEEEEDEPGSPG